MAPEDRDPQLDRALAGYFRAADESAAQPAQSPSARPDPCPDPEVLAAYHERSLLPVEMSSRKLHIVGCATCQMILTDLERTDDIALGMLPERAAAAAPAMNTTSFRPPESRRRTMVLHGTRWKWLAPAGAIAASLLVWVAWHEGSRPIATNPESIEMAKVQKPQAPMQQEGRQSPVSPPPVRESKLDSSKPAGAAKPTRSDALTSAPTDKDIANARSRSASPEIPSDRKGNKVAGAGGGEVAAVTETVEVQSAAPALQESAAVGLKKESALRDQQSNLQYQNLNRMAVNGPQVAGPAPLNQAAPATTKKAKSVPAAPPPAPASAGYLDAGTASALEIVSVSDPHLVLAADGSSSWRAGRAGLIEFSSDSGKTWTRQFSGVLTDLLTGSAPSPSICWMVGRSGTVVVTIDGGTHWKLIKIPITEDLGGIRATDATHAVIWNSRSTQYFQTRDGGQTWQSTTAP